MAVDNSGPRDRPEQEDEERSRRLRDAARLLALGALRAFQRQGSNTGTRAAASERAPDGEGAQGEEGGGARD